MDTSDINYDEPAKLPENADDARRLVEWHVRMARAAAAEADEIKASYAAEIERLVERRDNRLRILKNQREWHEAPVESWHKMLQRGDDRRATIEMPHGTSKITVPKKPKVELVDHDKTPGRIREWLIAKHPEVLELPNITTIRSLVEIRPGLIPGSHVIVDKADGEIVNGLTDQLPEPTYKLTLEPGAPL